MSILSYIKTVNKKQLLKSEVHMTYYISHITARDMYRHIYGKFISKIKNNVSTINLNISVRLS